MIDKYYKEILIGLVAFLLCWNMYFTFIPSPASKDSKEWKQLEMEQENDFEIGEERLREIYSDCIVWDEERKEYIIELGY